MTCMVLSNSLVSSQPGQKTERDFARVWEGASV